MLETPVVIRELQRKLYHKAKQEKEFRFYLLYDKVYRMDILNHAYRVVKANKGAAGADGITFEDIEERDGGAQKYLEGIAGELKRKEYRVSPVRRVYIPKADGNKRSLGIPTIKDRVVQMAVKIVIEPIFEADFQENSYGFRPKRNAHQAVADVSRQLSNGKMRVIDADITKYFDTILHDKLMELVAKRIVDKNILKLINMWLKAPVVEDDNGKKKYEGNDRGTPQGGVISPLLANIYLNVLDTLWKAKKVQERLGARLVRYADDAVAVCRDNTDRILKGMKTVLGELGLSLNEAKTKVVDARKEEFYFLGFAIGVRKSAVTGGEFPLIHPSKKAMKHIRAEIKRLTDKSNCALPTDVVIRRVNELVRGWVGYFRYGHCSRDMSKLKRYLEERIQIYLRNKHGKRRNGFMVYPYRHLYEDLGLYKIPTSAPYMRTAKALGRR
jgi:RNA-directed DNA polymerase